MKHTILTLTITGLIAAGVPNQAQAGEREAAYLAAGMMTGMAMHHVATRSSQDCDTRVTYTSPARPSGYYEWQTVRTWVPGYYTVEHTRFGPRRVWVNGYYETRRERVWVSTPPVRYRTQPVVTRHHYVQPVTPVTRVERAASVYPVARVVPAPQAVQVNHLEPVKRVYRR
jgi:hypothetical protein